MQSKRFKLSVIVVVVISIISISGFVIAKKIDFGQGDKDGKKVATIMTEGIDSDNDGLSDDQERELGTNIYNADSDGDSHLDGEEVKNGFNPLQIQSDDDVDLDQDGLVGKDEDRYGTDPRLADSDFDGYGDGEEIASGHDPLQADLSDYVAINAVANADQDGRSAETNLDNDNDSDSDGASEDNVLEVSQTDRQQVSYLEDAFSAQDVGSLQDDMTNYIQSQDNVETVAGQVQLAEIAESEIKIAAGTSDEQVRDYITTMGNILYQSFNFQEQASSYDMLSTSGVGSSLMYQFTVAISNSLDQVEALEVPREERIIGLHKKIVASLRRSEYLAEEINNNGGSTTVNQDGAIAIMNGYAELAYLLKVQIVDSYLAELDQIAEEKNLKTK
ncbi:MAG: hypothetical protein HQ530_03140 [Parcubacteria group bacterium]|nr:hypothetical protein [Parcubacteria group bacterium]